CCERTHVISRFFSDAVLTCRHHRAQAEYRGPQCNRYGLHKSAQSSDGLADDERIHLAGAFIRIDGLCISDETANMVLQKNAVPAEQLARVADSFAALDRREHLCKGRVLVQHLSLDL